MGGTPAGEDTTVIVTTGCASFLPALAEFYEVSIRRSRDENKKHSIHKGNKKTSELTYDKAEEDWEG